MCQNNLLIERKTNQPIDINKTSHSFVYRTHEQTLTLLDNIEMMGVINYTSCYKIDDEMNTQYGVKRGYVFVIGEKDE